jgi:alkylhydroperoxidase family enzyme
MAFIDTVPPAIAAGEVREMYERFELVTLSAAMAIGSALCSLAHGKALTEHFGVRDLLAIVSDGDGNPLSEAEKAMARFARKIARHAASVTAADVEELKRHGFGDAEIFDIAAVATARTFFAQLCEGLGVVNDHAYSSLDPRLRAALAVGRPIQFTEPEHAKQRQDLEFACG